MPLLKRPREPGPGECCGNGCPRCVWDVYYDALAAYEEERKAVENRNHATDESSTLMSEEEEEEEETTDSEDWSQNFIGSVVVRYISSPTDVSSPEDIILRHIDPSLAPVQSVKLLKCSGDLVGSVLRSETVPKAEERGDRDAVRHSGEVYLVDIEANAKGKAIPGDVAEIFVPNHVKLERNIHGNMDGVVDVVGAVCRRLGVDPDQWCELHRSPFVPDNNFPPWLPLRRPITIRNLLSYYVDLSTNAFLHPSFFQSLLRLHENNSHDLSEDEVAAEAERVDLLRTCAAAEFSSDIIRRVNRNSACYPTILNALNAFSFVKVPLDRFLEISSKLRARKFSVVKQSSSSLSEADCCSSTLGTTRLCFRETRITIDTTASGSVQNIQRKRTEGVDFAYLQCPPNHSDHDAMISQAAEHLGSLLAAQREGERKDNPSWEPGRQVFCGHVSSLMTKWALTPLCAAEKRPPSLPPLYLSTALFGQSAFSKTLMDAVTPIALHRGTLSTDFVVNGCHAAVSSAAKAKLSRKLYLLGMGTGMAPLMSAVYELRRHRQSVRYDPEGAKKNHSGQCADEYVGGRSPRCLPLGSSTAPPFDCTVWYGARTSSELVFHDSLRSALEEGAITSYQWAISRSTEDDARNKKDELESKLPLTGKECHPETCINTASQPFQDQWGSESEFCESRTCVSSPFRHITDILKEDVHAQAALREQLISGTASLFACGPPAALHGIQQWIQNLILSHLVPQNVLPSSDTRVDIGLNGDELWRRLEENRQVVFDVWSSWN